MKCGHYYNRPFLKSLKIPIKNLENLLKTYTIKENDYRDIAISQTAMINLNNFCLYTARDTYPIAASTSRTKSGSYIVAEKWTYPYWKNKDYAYLPAKNNPIGKYLIILAQANPPKKVNTSIHSCPFSKNISQNFEPGNKTTGCVRLRYDDMKQFFHYIQPGDTINIYK